MGKKKKNKKAITKRSAKSKLKKQKKRELRLVKSRVGPDTNYQFGPPFDTIETPEGFRSVSMSQALIEYAQPVMDMRQGNNIEDSNRYLQIPTLIWNYSISLDDEKDGEKERKEIIAVIKETLQMNEDEAIAFLQKMINRKEYLFPADIQPTHSRNMFLRKNVRHLIPEFNYDNLIISETPMISDHKDEELIDSIELMDRYITDRSDYGEWEKHYFRMEEQCNDGFKKWLTDKGLDEFSENFSFCAETYLNFIYRYEHHEIITLGSVTLTYLEEFFSDHLLSKVHGEPHEFVNWPPAIKAFYIFLSEKGYLHNSEPILLLIDQIEPYFIEILRKEFG